jgi:N-acyl-D-amino-acid deacylase
MRKVVLPAWAVSLGVIGGTVFAVGCTQPPAPPAADAAVTSGSTPPDARAAPPEVVDAAATGIAADPPPPPFSSPSPVSVWIKGGDVVDGRGGPARRADLVVVDRTIVHVGDVAPSLTAELVVDASGKLVAPGFIDAHAHGDPLGPAEAQIAMGVTTIVVGQDGRSPTSGRLAPWIRKVDQGRPALHVATLVGHGSVRQLAGVGAKVTDAALGRMVDLVAEELDAGAAGLSTGLEYQPGRSAEIDELVAIARPVADRDGVVMSHLRTEDDDAIEGAIEELLTQGRESGARVHVAHIKVVYGKGRARGASILGILERARDAGVGVTADIYPYDASYTSIGIVFPDFAKPPNVYRDVVAKQRPKLEAYLRERIRLRNGPEATLFGTGSFAGKTLAEVAADKKKPFEDVLIDDVGPGGVSAAYFVMDDELQSALLLDPHVMIGSDGGGGGRHPRGFGTFARVLRVYVTEREAMSIEEAIRKMTSLPARTLRLDHLVGTLERGKLADVVIFDPRAVADRATFEAPYALSEGMDWVFVAGRAVRKNGTPTAARPGGFIGPQRTTHERP